MAEHDYVHLGGQVVPTLKLVYSHCASNHEREVTDNLTGRSALDGGEGENTSYRNRDFKCIVAICYKLLIALVDCVFDIRWLDL